jgi:hypothetical protein
MQFVKGLRLFSLRRIAIILLMMVAWLALSNHCVIGACATTVPVAKGCPMHAESPGKTPAQSKDTNQQCCKTLRAVVAAKMSVKANTLDFVLKPFLVEAKSLVITEPSRFLLALDTGPPGALSFSESVLQRSILAHAPPVQVGTSR